MANIHIPFNWVDVQGNELEYIKGKEPNKEIKNHDKIVNKNAC